MPKPAAASNEAAFNPIRDRPLVDTQAEHLLAVIRARTVSTNIFLRRYHYFALGLNWIPWPILPEKLWPPVRHRDRRRITRLPGWKVQAVRCQHAGIP